MANQGEHTPISPNNGEETVDQHMSGGSSPKESPVPAQSTDEVPVDAPPTQIPNTDTMNSQGSQGQPSPQVSTTTDDDVSGGIEAQNRFANDFPGGYRRLFTNGLGLRCGLFAVQRMMQDLDLPGFEVPDMDTLLQVVAEANQQAYDQVVGPHGEATQEVLSQIVNDNMFGADQLDQVVRIYGERYGANLRLGLVRTGTSPQMVPRQTTNEDETMIWVHYDPAGVGHFSAIARPDYKLVDDDHIAKFDDKHFIANLSKMAVLIQSYYESHGLPTALKGKTVREVDWNSAVKEQNAALKLLKTAEKAGLKLTVEITEDDKAKGKKVKGKTAKDKTPDDKIFLRAANNVFTRNIDPAAVRYNPAASDIWELKSRSSKYAEKRATSKNKAGAKKTEYLDAPPVLRDMISRTTLRLMDMVFGALGYNNDDKSKSVGRDAAMIATGADYKKLVESGLMTEKGKERLEKVLVDEEEKRKSRKSVGGGETPSSGSERRQFTRPAGVARVSGVVASTTQGPDDGGPQALARGPGGMVANNPPSVTQGATGITGGNRQTTLSMTSSGVGYTTNSAASSPTPATTSNMPSAGRSTTTPPMATASAPATLASRSFGPQTPTAGTPVPQGPVSPLRDDRKRRQPPSPSSDRDEGTTRPSHLNSFGEVERNVLISSMRAEEPDQRGAVRNMLRRSLTDLRTMGYPTANTESMRLFQQLFPGEQAFPTDDPEEDDGDDGYEPGNGDGEEGTG